MKETFVQYGPDGNITSEVRTKNAHETIAMLRWMFSLRNKGYAGPFPIEHMLEKIRRTKKMRM